MFNQEHNITLRVKSVVLVRWYFIVSHCHDAVVWECVAAPSASVSVSASHQMRNVPFGQTFTLIHWQGNCIQAYFQFLLLGSLFIHLWQSTCLLHCTPAIFLSALHVYFKSASTPFHKFSSSYYFPSSSRWTFFFFSNFQHNLAVIDGSFRLTTCLGMRGMASTLRRIFFWEGVN